MPLGFHVSIAGGLYKAIERTTALGCDSFQIFCRNPRGWKLGEVSEESVESFKRARRGASMWPVVVHTSYLINLSTPDSALFKKSVALFTKELETASRIGADYLVTHPGSYGQKDIAFAIERVVSALKEVHSRIKSTKVTTKVLIENTAGGGTQTGRSLEDIGSILKKTKPLGTGLCFDTCHGFASGLPMEGLKETASLVAAIDRAVGIKNLKLIHLNDSKGALSSNLDRHEHIGKGTIGTKALKNFINHPKIRKVPLILETPKDDETSDIKNLRAVRRMQGEKLR